MTEAGKKKVAYLQQVSELVRRLPCANLEQCCLVHSQGCPALLCLELGVSRLSWQLHCSVGGHHI